MNKRKIVLVASPGYGHLYPLIQLSEIIAKFNKNIDFLTSLDYLPQIALKHTWKAQNINMVGLDDGSAWDALFSVDTIPNHIKPFEEYLSKNKNDIKHIVLELFMIQLAPSIINVGLPFSILSPMSCSSTSSFINPTTPSPQFVKNLMKAFIENHSHAKYLLCNSFQKIEPDFQKVTAWIKGDVIVKLIGPLHLYTQHTLNDETISNFLTDKPEKSVIFISLGSTGKLTPEQTREFYHALIESKKPFIWTCQNITDLPNESIVQTQGLLLSWSPQTSILSHPSIACFVSHCGWNSILESISFGVPLICWPLFADQHANARMLDELKIGKLVPGTKSKGEGRFVPKRQIIEVFEGVMECSDNVMRFKKGCEESVDGGLRFFEGFLKDTKSSK